MSHNILTFETIGVMYALVMNTTPIALEPALWILGASLILTIIRCYFSKYKTERINHFLGLCCLVFAIVLAIQSMFVYESEIVEQLKHVKDLWGERYTTPLAIGAITALIICFFIFAMFAYLIWKSFLISDRTYELEKECGRFVDRF